MSLNARLSIEELTYIPTMWVYRLSQSEELDLYELLLCLKAQELTRPDEEAT